MSLGLGLIILCGLLSLVYGGFTVSKLMAMPAGTPRMQEISAAVREGAQAYLFRQYTTIAGVGVVVFIILGLLLGWRSRSPSGGRDIVRRRWLHRHEVSVRANVRTADAATKSLGGRP